MGFGVPYSIVAQFDSLDAHHRSRDLGADRPGRTQESANAAHHAVEPRTDFHRAGKTGFMRLIARFLDEAGARGDYDALLVVAPTACLRSLCAAMQPTTRRKVIATKAKELMKIPLAQLAQHLSQVVAMQSKGRNTDQ